MQGLFIMINQFIVNGPPKHSSTSTKTVSVLLATNNNKSRHFYDIVFFFKLSTVKSSEIFPRHNGYDFISESFARN